jgi:hypothetical protein
MHGADVDSPSFSFNSGRNKVFDSLAEDVDGTIDTVTVEPTEVIVDSRSTACLRLDEVGCVGRDFENHIACVVADDGIGIGVEVVHGHAGLGNCAGGWFGLFGSNLVESGEDTGIASAAIIKKGAAYRLDAVGALLVEKRGRGNRSRALGPAWAVGGFDPRVRGMLVVRPWNVVEIFEGPIDIARHGNVNVALVVLPIEVRPQYREPDQLIVSL